MYYIAPHEARDEKKLQAMIETLNSGGALPPVLVMGEVAFTGSHRIAAWEALDMEVETVELSDDDYIATMEALYMEPGDEITDYSEFCYTLHRITSDDDVKSAIADQMD